MRNHRRGTDLRESWERNLAPYLGTWRRGGGRRPRVRHGARMRAHPRGAAAPQRRRWLLLAAGAGVVAVVAARAASAIRARQEDLAQYPQGEFGPAGGEPASPGQGRQPHGQQPQAQQAQAETPGTTAATAAGRRARQE